MTGLFEKLEGAAFRGLRHRGQDNLGRILQKQDIRLGIGFSWLRMNSSIVFRVYGNKSSGYTRSNNLCTSKVTIDMSI